MNTDRETSEPTPGSKDYWMKNVPRMVRNSGSALSYRDVLFEAYLTDEEKKAGLDETLLELEERGELSIPNPINLRRAVWELVYRGEIEFDLDRNLRTPEGATLLTK